MPIRDELPLPYPEVSRREFARLLSLGAATLAFPRGSLEGHFAREAMQFKPPAGAIRLNSNENPLGPSRAAMKAISDLGTDAGRYPFQLEDALGERLAALEGVPVECIETFQGSSDPLHRAMLAWTSPEKALVYAEPGYEAGWRACKVTGAEVVQVPLLPSLAHDVRSMCATQKPVGIVYICNPNNPTGTTTPRDEILWALANKPAGSILIVDEAYIHFCDEQTVAPLVVDHADLLVLRTFSKLYGMAGLRMGVAIAQPQLLHQLRAFGMLSASAPALLAARASVDDTTIITERKAVTRRARDETFTWLDKHNYTFHPSVSNCFMLDAKQPPADLAKAMAERGVIIGRSWPVWPTYARISVGTPDEMKAFCRALDTVA